MDNDRPVLNIEEFSAINFNLKDLSERLTELKKGVSRTPTPVTEEQLQAIDNSVTSILLLQTTESEGKKIIVGLVHLSVIYLEDRAHLGPIIVDTNTPLRGHGTPLIEAAITHLKDNYPSLRRLDLSNRPSHDLTDWYKKFGFSPRIEEEGDPTTVYRLLL